MTTRGMKDSEMRIIVKFIDKVLKDPNNLDNLEKIKSEVNNFCSSFPLYKEFT